ncbi:DNA-(apurinic or apyrimidinic site) lyase [Bertholletia excelsa]
MNSRTNHGQIPAPWVPATPGNPIPMRSNCDHGPAGANWQDALEAPMEHFFHCLGTNDGVSYNSGGAPPSDIYASFNPLAELLGIKTTESAEASAKGLHASHTNINTNTNTPMILNSYSHVDSSWTEGNFTSLLLSVENPIACDGFPPAPSMDIFHAPFQHNYKVNSSPRSEADAASSTTNSFLFAPVTPDHSKHFEKHRSDILNFSLDESSSQEKDKQDNLLTFVGSELLQNFVDSSSAATSTALKEISNSEQGGDGGIELNKTPPQKPPKRRKHRPKVIVEGKPKRTPKPKVNANSKENTPGKRKYTRKKSIGATETLQAAIANEVTASTFEANTKSMENSNSKEKTPGKRKYIRKKSLGATEGPHTDVTNEVTAPNFEDNTNSKENMNSKAKTPGKRKYVRKKSLGAIETQQIGVTNEVTVPILESGAKSCRKKLNFDSESNNLNETQGSNVQVQNQENQVASSLDPKSNKFSAGTNRVAGAGLAEQSKVKHGYTAENHQTGSMLNLTHSVNQMLSECASPAAVKHNALNVIARSVNLRNLSPSKKSNKSGYTKGHQNLQVDLNRNISEANTCHEHIEQTWQMMWQGAAQASERSMCNSDQRRGSKREYSCAMQQTTLSAKYWTDSPILCQEVHQVDNQNSSGNILGAQCSESHKKKRAESIFQTALSATPHGIILRDGSKHSAIEDRTSFYSNSYGPHINGRTIVYSNGYSSHINIQDERTCKMKTVVNGTCDSCSHSITDECYMQNQLSASELHLNTKSIAEKIYSRSTQNHDVTLSGLNLPLSTLSKSPTSVYEQEMGVFYASMLKRRNEAPTSSIPVPSGTNEVLLQGDKVASHDYQKYSVKEKGLPEKWKNIVTIDEITCRLQALSITGRAKETDGPKQNALVPYKGDGTMVPYKGFDPIKKSRTRPKVDLDPETNRLWNLLMGKEGSEDIGTEDKDKQKWWEEERKVFRGRADSFIARMHLVQGDRRFSPWKGSVVDSVIGVFLTQNVSDHLSSSAFMCLAARFPLHSPNNDQTCHQSRKSMVAEEPPIQILDPVGVIKSVPHNESEHRREDPISVLRTSLATDHQRMAEQKDSSSQNSSDSFVQVSDHLQSCSGSNSDDSTQWAQYNKIPAFPTNPLQMQRTSSFQVIDSTVTGTSCSDNRSNHSYKQSEDKDHEKTGNQEITKSPNLNFLKNISDVPFLQQPTAAFSHFQLHRPPNLALQEEECIGTSRKESISSWSSSDSGFSMAKGVDQVNSRIPHAKEQVRDTIIEKNGIPITDHTINQEISSQPVPHTGLNQLSHNAHQQEKSKTLQLEKTIVEEPKSPFEAFVTWQSCINDQAPNDPTCTTQALGVNDRDSAVDQQTLLEDRAIEANVKQQVGFSSQVNTKMSQSVSKARKGKAEDGKRKSFDWDQLRKQVQVNGRRKERSKETMDSLDYEALRRADVKEISGSIKERGMNNMLAARIKDFLDRLVREHGSIDLEWLRDVPPDKAKDYLLSVRGLGIKSVECVRLLTLHHVAFPVDTNVGRIAVRLGWVPLQPLPESLQLHLLELYPVLESIQKYLWPRLCKLDQRTLYELHYQMITFGKVFCTKNRPNCNACPMRGECRHFASAFASARLALPGPEEKSIVSSTVSVGTDQSPPAAIKPLLLPSPGINEPRDIGTVVNNCEPIVEEPKTPEPESPEVTVSDIEDAFYEDPDEIPTIKLDIEEFTANVQSFMHGNMELQESDMSKALVALNPEAASIPMPKLKNVSRLRTEHHVYELPDTHPLLEGLDKREPDDPSPYLLAIWTPGETANSIQPPESRCGSKESGELCQDKTCFSCNSVREANSQTVRGTILIPCRTAMRGSFPLNGTYFQVNEMFADHESSVDPINVPRLWIWNLPRRTVYFGTSVSTIFKGLSTEGIQYCFWRGFVCVRGFDRETRAPRPLMARLHFPASKLQKTKKEDK